MATNYTYDLAAVNLSISSIEISAGGGAAGFIEITMPRQFGSTSGVNGDTCSYRMGDNIAPFRLTLLDPSIENESLIALFSSDLDADNGAGVGAFLLEDLNSGFELRGDCRIEKLPDFTKAAEVSDWVYEGAIFQPRAQFRPRLETT